MGEIGARGECVDCARPHSLPEGGARIHALGVMEEFARIGRLDYRVSEDRADPKLDFARLFGERGNMFGVLECVDAQGETRFLRAFSSLTDGIRTVDGWVPPILSADLYHGVILPVQQEIKSLTAEIQRREAVGAPIAGVEARRRRISQRLWKRMCTEYRFQNFRGETRTLSEAVVPGTPITGGMGECCAPKLLNHAAREGLRPIGIAEFYWGDPDSMARVGEPRGAGVATRRDRHRRRGAVKPRRVVGEFYPSCAARCQPLLGFMLCGLDE